MKRLPQIDVERNIEIGMKGGLEKFVLHHELMYIDETKRAGWDYLYEDCFNGINQIVENNLKGNLNEKMVNEVYKKMLKALQKASEKMKEFDKNGKEHPDAKPRWTNSWYQTFNNLIEYSKTAYTPNKKVITINMIDQFLRATF